MAAASAQPSSAAAAPVTPDGRYLVVRGRLWRCADPSLEPAERQRHVDALMRARRAVRDAPAEAARRRARAAVDRAKRALGERGAVWWTDGSPDFNRHLVKNSPYAAWYAARAARPPGARQIVAAILGALEERTATSSACPSEIARRLAPQDAGAWRSLMDPVRAAVARLSERGKVRVTRGAQVLTPAQFGGGPIRIRRGPKF